jgi:glycosyltransferase involved in cell wall biosynthesis
MAARDDRPSGLLTVGIDATPLLGERTGIGHVTANLLRALGRRDDLDVVAYAVSRTAGRDLEDLVPEGVRIGSSRLAARFVLPLWERFEHPSIERWTGRVDVVHATNYTAPPARAPVIVTVHDLSFVHRPDLVSDNTRRFFGGLVRTAIDRGATVHVVSDFVGDEVREVYSLPETRVVRVYPGIADVIGGDPSTGRALAGADTYVLALGQLEPRKNFPALVRAFDVIADANPDLHLVVAGPDGWGRDEFDAATRAARHGGRVRWLGYVSDDDRRSLLSGARVFAYPSLYEGFGHPPLEAMAAGIPVVAARSGAIPEIAGDAALLVDPTDERGLAEVLDTLVNDSATRDPLVARGKARAAEFRWTRATDGFLAMYTAIGSRN